MFYAYSILYAFVQPSRVDFDIDQKAVFWKSPHSNSNVKYTKTSLSTHVEAFIPGQSYAPQMSKKTQALGLLGKSCKKVVLKTISYSLSAFRNHFQWCHETRLGIKVQESSIIALSNSISQTSEQDLTVNAECHIPVAGHVLVSSIRVELQTGGQTYLILHKLACLWLLKMCTSWVSTHMARETLEETKAAFSTLTYFICGPIFGRGFFMCAIELWLWPARVK